MCPSLLLCLSSFLRFFRTCYAVIIFHSGCHHIHTTPTYLTDNNPITNKNKQKPLSRTTTTTKLAVIGGAVVGLLCAILVVMFIVYRMRKKDEGSYALDEPKRSPAVNSYAKNANNREFYA